MCRIGAVPVGFKSEEMIWEATVSIHFIRIFCKYEPFQQRSTKNPPFSLLCAMLRPLLGTCLILDEAGRAMGILLP